MKLPFAYEPCGDGFRFYDLRNYHFEDSPEAFLSYLRNKQDFELATQLQSFLDKYDLYNYWARYTRYRGKTFHKTMKPTKEETLKKGGNVSESV